MLYQLCNYKKDTWNPSYEKYTSEDFVDEEDVNHWEVSENLKQIRIKNLNHVIIGHLNINTFALKLNALKTIISNNGYYDIIYDMIRYDDSYPTTQLTINGYNKPYILDRNSNVGGILVC